MLVLATFVIRARYFGNPFVYVDEEFYLLTGDRMLHGALPYVDIWDRKPVGLFLLYAGIRLLGGDGIVQYQLVASGFAAATAVMIAILARRITTPATALIAALAYVPALAMNGGQGGQTPVFYNLAVIVAVWLVVRVAGDGGRPAARHVVLGGAGAMALVGIAMQIKYTAVFEGLYLGCALVWLGWRAGLRAPVLAAAALGWAGLAVLPTALAWVWYATHHQGPAFVYANFASIVARAPVGPDNALHDLSKILIRLLPFILSILFVEWLFRSEAPWQRDARSRAAHSLLAGWLVAAVAGFLLFGGYFNHYALPLLPPLAVLSAPLFAVRARGVGAVMATVTLAALLVAYPLDARKYDRRRGDAAYADRLVAQIAPRLHGGCLYILYGEPILYHLTHSCLPTRWPFPFHLGLMRESGALGVDPMAETRRILDTRPPVIVDRLTEDVNVNPAVQSLVRGRLARDYRLVFQYRHPAGPDADTDQVWERLPGR